MLTDLGLISALLVAGHLLRAAIPWLSRYLIPTSMLAGILGLIGGPGGLDLLPFSRNADGGPSFTSYPGILITLLFATLLLGYRSGSSSRVAFGASSTSFLFNLGSEFMQYGVTLCLGVALLSYVFVGLPPEFMVMLPAGFAGGHGTAALYADALPNWSAARSVGFTFATLGILSAVFGGLVLVNIARRRGWVARDATQHAGIAPEQSTLSVGQCYYPAERLTSELDVGIGACRQFRSKSFPGITWFYVTEVVRILDIAWHTFLPSYRRPVSDTQEECATWWVQCYGS